MGRKKKSNNTKSKQEEQVKTVQIQIKTEINYVQPQQDNDNQHKQKQQDRAKQPQQYINYDQFNRNRQEQYDDYDDDYNQYDQHEPTNQNNSQDSYQEYQSDRSDRYESGSEYDEFQRKERVYKYTSQDAKRLSKLGKRRGDLLFSVEECRDEIANQLIRLNKYYKYSFDFDEQSQTIEDGKKMTRTIYLKFECDNCPNQNKWTSISGTFEITFLYDHKEQLLIYHVQIFRNQCRICQQYMKPYVYQTQMDAMKMFFSVILTNIIDKVPPPKRPDKYYIKQVHWHKSQWCQACKLGRCTTQYTPKKNYIGGPNPK